MRTLIIPLGVVLLNATGIVSGAFEGQPPQKPDGPPRRLKEGETVVTVPPIIQQDLYQKACAFLEKVYPAIDKQWMHKELGAALLQDRYTLFRLNTGWPPMLRIGDEIDPLIEMSFPRPRYIAVFPRAYSSKSAKTEPAGLVVEDLEKPLTLEQAEVRAREALARIAGDARRSRAFTVDDSGESVHGQYDYFWLREADQDVLRYLGFSATISVCRTNGLVQRIEVWQPFPPPKISHAEAVKIAKAAIKRAEQGRVYFNVLTYACIDTPVWTYLVPPGPGGAPLHTTTWDANTGGLLYSEVLHGGTREKPYRNPKFFVPVTDELRKRNIEELIKKRVEELEKTNRGTRD